MRYYIIEISEGDSKIKGKSIYEYETMKEAIASWHKKLGVAMSSELYTSDLVMVIDSFGNIIKSEKYVAEVEEPTEEVTE